MSLFGEKAENGGVSTEEGFSTDITAEDEFDVTEAGIPDHAAIARIGVITKELRDGEADEQDNLLLVPFTLINSPHITKDAIIRGTFWLKHSNPKAENIGRGQFKALSRAAIGRASGNLSELTGTYVTVWVKGGDGSWPSVRNFKAANEEQIAEALTASGVGELT